MSIPTPAKAEKAVDIMFDAMEDHYKDLEAETSEFFKNSVVKLPPKGSMEFCVFGGLRFYSLFSRGKRMIIPDDQVPMLMKTSVKKVLRKRYALHVLHSRPNSSIDTFSVGVFEAIPCIAHGFKHFVPRFGIQDNPGICSKKPKLNFDQGYVFLNHTENILQRPIFRVTREPGSKGAGTYKTWEINSSASARFDERKLSGSGTSSAVDLRMVYHSDLWAEKLREVIADMRERNLF